MRDLIFNSMTLILVMIATAEASPIEVHHTEWGLNSESDVRDFMADVNNGALAIERCARAQRVQHVRAARRFDPVYFEITCDSGPSFSTNSIIHSSNLMNSSTFPRGTLLVCISQARRSGRFYQSRGSHGHRTQSLSYQRCVDDEQNSSLCRSLGCYED
jgi:hypothetical protein